MQKQIATPMTVQELIEAAAEVAGSQVKLAALLDMAAPTLIQMKQGKRPCNWRVRGKLRAVLGEDPAHAFMTAMAEDLALSDNADEQRAAESFKAMLEAFPDKEKSPADQTINGASSTWRNRRDSNPR